jgi:Domain of unknown function (DUF4279)
LAGRRDPKSRRPYLEIGAMKIQAHLSIVSDEATIRAIHEETNLPDASIRRLKARSEGSADDYRWHWETPRVPIDAENPDEGLKKLLQKYRPIFPAIREHPEEEADIYLQMVTEYNRGEEPQEISLSRETISLLSELGAALDNDVYVRG